MRKFGFKFFTTNFQTSPDMITEAVEYIASKPDMFMEISIISSTTEADLKRIKKQIGNTEVRLHAAYDNFDTGNREFELQNKKILAHSQKAADILGAKTIVVHSGYGHEKKHLEETARQFRLFHDERVVVENLPYYDNNGDYLHGSTAEEIAYIMNESGCGFCFDFSHAICAALSLNISVEAQLKSFYALNPTVYHMCDGDLNVAQDLHMHFGDGNFLLKHYLNDCTAKNAYITIETGCDFEPFNDLRIKDYQYLKSLQDIK